MSLLNDTEFRLALDKTDAILPRSLWQHLDEIAQYLALIGATAEALEVWKFVYSGVVIVPEGTSAHGDCSVSALCFFLKHDDISQGRPSSNNVKPGDDLERRVYRYDRLFRTLLTRDSPTSILLPNHIKANMRARTLAKVPPGEQFSQTELEALPFLDEFFATYEGPDYIVLDAHLLYADIALRHKRSKQAKEHFIAWYGGATCLNTYFDKIFGLYTVASLAFKGVLASQSKITPDERRLLVDALLTELKVRFDAPYRPRSAPAEIELPVFHSTLSLEPYNDDLWKEEWDLMDGRVSELPALDEEYPCAVAIVTPGETGGCRISVEFPDNAPSWNDAHYATTFPLRIVENRRQSEMDGRIGTLFPNSTTGGIDDVGLDVPSGEYDVLARFYLIHVNSVELRYWRVVLSLMPRGTLTLGLIKPEVFLKIID